MELFSACRYLAGASVPNASARLSETEARARHCKGTRYATLNARQHHFTPGHTMTSAKFNI